MEQFVGSNIVADENSVIVRFVPNVGTNPKAPVMRCLVNMPGALSGLVTEIPIFRSKDGTGYDVMMPGGRFPSLKAANLIVDGADGVKWETTTPEAVGKAKADAIPALIKDALGRYLITKQAEQLITFA